MGLFIGVWNSGAYTRGMMGRAPHTDSLTDQGALFTDHYGRTSCTAGCIRTVPVDCVPLISTLYSA